MKKQRDMVFLKGKESVFTNILLLVAIIIFIAPIVLILSLRFIYKFLKNTKESISVQAQIDPSLNKVY